MHYVIYVSEDGRVDITRNGTLLKGLVRFELAAREDAHGFRVESIVATECPRPARPTPPAPGPYSE